MKKLLTTKNKQHIFILAGEESGDFYGANLMRYIKQQNPNIVFSGIGGKNMEKQSLESMVQLEKIAVMGFWEVLKKVFFFKQLEKKLLKHIEKTCPEKIILIDYPGLNLRLATKINKLNVKTTIFYYISPQLWAWKEKRINVIKKYIDHLIVIFPFEKTWYNKRGMHVEYFGHPLVESIKKNGPAFQSVLKINPIKTLLFLPGSRLQEVKRHLPVFKKIINNFVQDYPKTEFVISSIKGLPQSLYNSFENEKVTLSSKTTIELLQQADVVVVASGTATLECALAKKPMVVIYKTSTISWLLSRLFLKVKFASIVNLLHGDKLVPELLQNNCNPRNVVEAINCIVEDRELVRLANGYKNIEQSLVVGNTYRKTDDFILQS